MTLARMTFAEQAIADEGSPGQGGGTAIVENGGGSGTGLRPSRAPTGTLAVYRRFSAPARSGERRWFADAGGRNAARRMGDYWSLVYEGRGLWLPHAKGLVYLAHLLRHPGREVHALDLAGEGADRVEGEPFAERAAAGNAGELLDVRARREYQNRLAELRELLEEAERTDDREAAERAGCELEFLERELSRAFGLGMRARKASDAAERARKAVGARLRDTIHRVGRRDPRLRRHLERSLRLGLFCCYEPERPTDWEV